MNKGIVRVICGNARGKSPAAFGYALENAFGGKEVFVVQFLKGKMSESESAFLKRLEPEVKFFRFDRESSYYEDLSPEEKEEEKINICNGIGFVKKVISIGECDVLILDEILGLVDLDIIDVEKVIEIIGMKDDETELVLTGRTLPEALVPYVDAIVSLDYVKEG